MLVYTGQDNPELLRRVLDLGVHGCLMKTALPSAVVNAVRAVAAGQRIVDPTVARRAGHAQLDRLTPRERDVQDLLQAGRSNQEIASALGVKVGTVEYHVTKIMAKLGVRSRTEAALWGRERPWE